MRSMLNFWPLGHLGLPGAGKTCEMTSTFIPSPVPQNLGWEHWNDMQSCKMTAQLYADPRGGSRAHDTLLTNLAATEVDLICKTPCVKMVSKVTSPFLGVGGCAMFTFLLNFSAFWNTLMSTSDFKTRKRNKGFTLIKYLKIKLTKSQVQS